MSRACKSYTSLILSAHFGPIVERVANVLINKGRSSLRQIVAFVGKNPAIIAAQVKFTLHFFLFSHFNMSSCRVIYNP